MVLDNLSDIEILGLTIYGEARGESILGQIAVGCVIRNRSIQRVKTFEQVCLESYQFSCWNKSDPNYPMLLNIADGLAAKNTPKDKYLIQCMYVAVGIAQKAIIDITKGADHYMTKELYSSGDRPKWADKVHNALTIDRHIFFQV